LANAFGIYDLLRPSFLAGLDIPSHVDAYLSLLAIDEFRCIHDDNSVVYVGHASFVGEGGALPQVEHHDPNGAFWRLDRNLTLQFRLTLPRDGASFIDSVLTVTPAPPGFAALNTLFSQFGDVEQAAGKPTEYPGVALRLELLLNTVVINLPRSKWRPGKLSPNGRVVEDPERSAEAVKFLLPSVAFVYEQADQGNSPLSFRVKSWGNPGFDAPSDLAAGEVVRMDPPIAISDSGRWGFGVDQVLVDLSPDHTPPEILQFYGADDAFEGIYLKEARFFYGDSDKDFAVNLSVRDVLISTSGEISLEGSVDLLFGPGAELRVETHLFEGKNKVEHKGSSDSQPVRLSRSAVAQLTITGGVPPHTVSMKLDGEEIFDPATGQASIAGAIAAATALPKKSSLTVKVTDATPGADQQSVEQQIHLQIVKEGINDDSDGATSDKIPKVPKFADPDVNINQAPDATSRTIKAKALDGSNQVEIKIEGAGVESVTVDGTPTPINTSSQTFKLPIDEDSSGSPKEVQVSWKGRPLEEDKQVRLHFKFNRPLTKKHVDSFVVDKPSTHGMINRVNGFGVAELRTFLVESILANKPLKIDAHASFESDADLNRNQILSVWRHQIVEKIVAVAEVDANKNIQEIPSASGDNLAKNANPPRRGNFRDRVAIITGFVEKAAPAETLVARISRGPSPQPDPIDPTAPADPPDPPKPQNKKPRFFRQLGFRTRIERGEFVLGEATAQVDFETDVEKRLRELPNLQDQRAEIRTTENASTAPVEDGVVDVLLQVTHDTATHQWTERVKFGAVEADRNGLAQMTNDRTTGNANVRLKDTLGALLTFAPIINETAGNLDPNSKGDWVKLGVAMGVPATLGALGAFQTHVVTLHGGELQLRQYIPPNDDASFDDAAILLDYSVDFGLKIPFLGKNPNPETPARVRYRAIGFRLDFNGELDYQPVFDTSRGYEIDLRDPGLIEMKEPWGNILKVASARVARFNPTTLEVDLRLNVDLGVVSFDQFKIKWPLDTDDPPMILPTSVRVDIPSTVVGSGSLNINDAGFEGSLDLSLVALKLRVAGSLGVQQLHDAATGRDATGIFVGLSVDFPTPIVLGASGLGLYGLSGLFGMHYKRLEPAAIPNSAASPALRWLKLAEGTPNQLKNSAGVALWGPEFDRWSFGVGALMGTTEGGFLANFRGSLVVELPGPRIIIFVKAQFLTKLPGLGEDANQLDVGLLGVLDFNFERQEIQIGLLANFEVKKLLQIEAAIDVFFDLEDSSNWHVHLGTMQTPVRATVLNLGRGKGYFMVSGTPLDNFPGPNGPETLTPIAVATGLEASVILGRESSGLYAQVAAGADLGISFSPFHIVGQILLSGSLRLFVVSIGVDGKLSVAAPDPTIIQGEICGKVSFMFFSVKGCVGLTIGSGTHELPPPPLVRNLYLQSFAPVISAGQAGARPIDASLGDAIEVGQDGDLPVVPIDSVPVLQLHASPEAKLEPQWFVEDPGTAPNKTPAGWIEAGGDRRIRYTVTNVSIDPPIDGGEKPPATWRSLTGPGSNGAKTDIDLALISREPTPYARALERSTELQNQITVHWGDLCKQVAPPSCVLWTFCHEKLGPSEEGWCRTGIAWPDPPDTHRGEPVPTKLRISEPSSTSLQELLGVMFYDSNQDTTLDARIVGDNVACNEDKPTAPGICVEFPGRRTLPNPLVHRRVTFTTGDFRGNPLVSNTFQNGLRCRHSLEIKFPRATNHIVLYLAILSGRKGTVRAFDSQGVILAIESSNPPATVVTIRARGIRSLVIESPQAETTLTKLCYQGFRFPVIDPGDFPIEIVGTDRRRRLLTDLRTRLRVANEHIERRANATSRTSEASSSRRPTFGERRLGRRVRPPITLPEIASPKLNQCCFRALQLPQGVKSEVVAPNDFQIPNGVIAGPEDPLSITLFTRSASKVLIYLLLNRVLLTTGGLRVKQLNAGGEVLKDDQVSDLSITTVSDVATGLPDRWVDSLGPWHAQTIPVSTYFRSLQASGLVRVLLEVNPDQNSEALRLVVPEAIRPVADPRVLVGIVEVCSLAEEQRVNNDSEIQQGRIETLTGVLSNDANMPLLRPDQPYTVTVDYDAESDPGDGSDIQVSTNLSQSFRFRTDNATPESLEPWVLATSPRHESRFEFFEDAVQIVFNDSSVLALFKAYGKQLKVIVRSADGVPMPADHIEEFTEVDAELSTPFRDFIEALVEAGLLPCIGAIDIPKNASFTVPVALQPLMDYTLDIELDPTNAPQSTQLVTPLFRRSFSTGRYADPQQLAAAIVGNMPRHQALNSPLTLLPFSAGVHVTPDKIIQDALRAAGQAALGAAKLPGITIFWTQSVAGDLHTPHAIMIDSPEPLWRTRAEPRLEQVPDQSDPAYQRVVPQDVSILEIVELGSNRVSHYVRSPSGTRTIVFIKPHSGNSDPAPIELSLHRPASSLFQQSPSNIPLITLPLTAGAPWEFEI
jgi:hypothetical protein